MLGKLIKYEFKSTARTYLPLYGVLILFALINRMFISLNFKGSSLAEGIAALIFLGIIVAIFVITLIVTIQRFYRNLLTDEGYLMFTLPAKSTQLINSKLIVASCWIILSGLITTLSILILAINTDIISVFFREWQRLVNEFYLASGMNLSTVAAEIILMMIIATISSVLMIYASITIGHLVNRNRILASFGAFLGLTIIAKLIVSLIGTVAGWTNLEELMRTFSTNAAFHFLMLGAACVYLLLGIIYYFITNYILSRKLNLE